MVHAPAIWRQSEVNPWLVPRGPLTLDRDNDLAGGLACCIVPTTAMGIVDLVTRTKPNAQTDTAGIRRETRGLTIDCTTNAAGDGAVKFPASDRYQLTGDIDFSWFWIFKPIGIAGIYPTTCGVVGSTVDAGRWVFTAASGSRLIQVCTTPGSSTNINFGGAGNWPTTVKWYSIGFTRKTGGTYKAYQDGVLLDTKSNGSIASGTDADGYVFLGSPDGQRSRSYYGCLYVWKRRLLSDIEMRALHAKPYRVVRADFPDHVSRAGTSPPPPPPSSIPVFMHHYRQQRAA